MSSTRLLPLLFLMSLPSLALSQQDHSTKAVVPGSCPVTKPADRPFRPPSPYKAKPSVGQFWFGTDRLWTALPVSGMWSGLPHYTPTEPTFRQKIAFWGQGFDPRLNHGLT